MKSNKKIVLAIDDMTLNLISIKSALAVYSDLIDLRLAKTCKIALDVLSETRVDLILLDIEMPDISGFELLQIIRSQDRHKDTPIIFVTSNGDPGTVARAYSFNVEDFIVKPIKMKAMTRKIMKVLDIELPTELL